MEKRHNIDALTLELFKDLIASADDSHDNQIRVTEDGELYISSVVAADNIEGLRFRFETFDAGNEYVGESAASDDKYIKKMYEAVMKCWEKGRRGYIDYY